MDSTRYGFTACRYRGHSVLILVLPWVCAPQEAAHTCCETSLLAGLLVLLIIQWPRTLAHSTVACQHRVSEFQP